MANAALPASGPIVDFSPEQIDRALDVNLRAPIQLTRALVPGMVERGAGHVVLVSSLSGKVASIGSSLYSATKFGLRGFASGLREDLHGTGVGVTVVFPASSRTPACSPTPACACRAASARAALTRWRRGRPRDRARPS